MNRWVCLCVVQFCRDNVFSCSLSQRTIVVWYVLSIHLGWIWLHRSCMLYVDGILQSFSAILCSSKSFLWIIICIQTCKYFLLLLCLLDTALNLVGIQDSIGFGIGLHSIPILGLVAIANELGFILKPMEFNS